MKATVLAAGPLAAGLLAVTVAAPAAAQEHAPPQADTAWLVASALLAAPESLRDGAEVRAWTAGDHLTVLRPGTNGIICLADHPDTEGFAAACYHDSLEPFMERGRELAREGVEGARRNEARWREIEDGTLPMPAMAMVYNLRFPTTDFDPATTDPATGGRLHAIYTTGATVESTGLSDRPGQEPWLMLPGTPSAHVMIAVPPTVAPPGTGREGSDAPTALADTLLALTHDLVASWTRLEPDDYLDRFSDDLAFYFEGAAVPRSKFEAVVRETMASLRESTFEVLDPDVVMLGDSAGVVSFCLREVMVDRGGAVAEVEGALTLVYQRRDGDWVVVRAHESLTR